MVVNAVGTGMVDEPTSSLIRAEMALMILLRVLAVFNELGSKSGILAQMTLKGADFRREERTHRFEALSRRSSEFHIQIVGAAEDVERRLARLYAKERVDEASGRDGSALLRVDVKRRDEKIDALIRGIG